MGNGRRTYYTMEKPMVKKISITPPSGQDPDTWLAEARALALEYKRRGILKTMNVTDLMRLLLKRAMDNDRAWFDSEVGRDAVKAELERL